jgi:hypothetical protein
MNKMKVCEICDGTELINTVGAETIDCTACKDKTTITDIEDYVLEYFNGDWLWDHLFVTFDDDNSVVIRTPFLNRHNDYIDLYVTEKDGKLYLSDDGYTLIPLTASGIKGKTVLDCLATYGVSVDLSTSTREMTIGFTKETFSQAIHSLLQAILTINGMIEATRHNFFC